MFNGGFVTDQPFQSVKSGRRENGGCFVQEKIDFALFRFWEVDVFFSSSFPPSTVRYVLRSLVFFVLLERRMCQEWIYG